MKILGFDINRQGIKLPFTKGRIPIPLMLSAVAAFFSNANAAGCRKPIGDYELSSSAFSIKPYYSSDPNVPPGLSFRSQSLHHV